MARVAKRGSDISSNSFCRCATYSRRVVVGAGVRYEGKTLLPDVDERCEEVAGWITPRVGGVGPTTIAMLFRNCVEAAERTAGII